MAGREIFAKRKQLRAFSNPSPPVQVEIQNTFTSFKTTEICVTSELATINRPNIANVFLSSDRKSRDLPSPGSRDEEVSPGKSYDQYSVTIRSTPMSPRFEVPQSMPRGQSTMQQRGNRVAMDANTAAWGYTKVALLFFVSLLVTWVSSSPPPNPSKIRKET